MGYTSLTQPTGLGSIAKSCTARSNLPPPVIARKRSNPPTIDRTPLSCHCEARSNP
ncbi:hypothetical protein [Geminocystis sp. CENA526]|uniref:hypothetical protein n=1 Tax=Geminocystis sp. CENA526 TaxID=1355871 RepID=UPI003D6E85F2